VAVVPGKLGIGVFSPRLDARGNSLRGLRVCEELSAASAAFPSPLLRSCKSVTPQGPRDWWSRNSLLIRN
jgi:hypothetical protein